MLNLDDAFAIFQDIYNSLPENLLESEQDVRFQIINRLLTEVLGWSYDDISTEPHSESGYTDYLLSSGGRSVFVIEAKRLSTPLLATEHARLTFPKVGGPALKHGQPGIEQAVSYSRDHSVPFACLTNGDAWIGFRAVRADGVPYKDGKAIAFPTLAIVRENFPQFYEIFSSYGVINRLYDLHISRAEGHSFSVDEPLFSVLERADIRMLPKSSLSQDIDQVFNEFFSVLSGDDDPDLLSSCFVETTESHNADRSLEKITSDLVNSISSLNRDPQGLQREIRSAISSKRGQTVLIIGNKGAGKSTFIDRFFRNVLKRSLREKCLVIKIDLGASTGSRESLDAWLTKTIISAIENTLYVDGIPQYDELRGIFYRDYQRWSRGEYKYLHDTDADQFRIEFGKHMAQMRTDDPFDYMISCLNNAVDSRQLMPCLIFDNADHFDQPFQEAVFQYSRAIFSKVIAFIVMPITDRTMWQLSKSGPFQSFTTRTFFLPVPSTKDVLSKRVEFIKRKMDGESADVRSYLTTKGIRLDIPNIQAFAACVEEAFIRTDFISRRVSWLSNFDLRRSLYISQSIITAPVLKVDELLKAYFTHGQLEIPKNKIMQSLLYRDYNHFLEDSHEFIMNMFVIEQECVTTPLLSLRILKFLQDVDAQAANTKQSYIKRQQLINYFDPMGIPVQAILILLHRMFKFRVVEAYDPSVESINEETTFCITNSGKMHIEMALQEQVYVSEMAFSTPIRSYAVVEELRALSKRRMNFEDFKKFRSIFINYCLVEDQKFVTVPSIDPYGGQRLLIEDLRCWIV